jgi:hypothetical protein
MSRGPNAPGTLRIAAEWLYGYTVALVVVGCFAIQDLCRAMGRELLR